MTGRKETFHTMATSCAMVQNVNGPETFKELWKIEH